MKALRTWLNGERGRISSLAKEMKVTPGAVWQWAEDRVPAERVFRVSELTGLPIKKLRPDLYKPAPTGIPFQ